MRTAEISRVTKETNIQVKLTLEGGKIEIKTRIGFFDHMLTALAFYAGWGLELEVEGDLHVDGHHTVEDTGIVLGQALKQALGEKRASGVLALPLFPWMKPCALPPWIFLTGPSWFLTRRCPRG